MSIICAFVAGMNTLAVVEEILEQSPVWLVVLNAGCAVINSFLAVIHYIRK